MQPLTTINFIYEKPPKSLKKETQDNACMLVCICALIVYGIEQKTTL